MRHFVKTLIIAGSIILPLSTFAGTASLANFSQLSYSKECLGKLKYSKKKPVLDFNCSKDGLCILLADAKVVKKSPIIKCETQASANDVIKEDLEVYQLSAKGFLKQETANPEAGKQESDKQENNKQEQ